MESKGIIGIKASDWNNLFWHLSKRVGKGRILVVFDEISWMGGKDPDFLGHLKTAWDMYFSKNPNLIFALCGSISSWIEKNILSHTGFLGRITIDLVLEELPLNACNMFWYPKENRVSAHEKFKILSVTGGVPFYLEHIDPNLSAEQNIRELCFTKGSLFVREFDQIFSDLFSNSNKIHKQIVQSLVSGPKELSTICKELEKTKGGIYLDYLDELIKSGFVKKDPTWDLKSQKPKKKFLYRLSDNYLRFYLKYISPNIAKIENESIPESIPKELLGWESIMGLQFENLVLQNRKTLWKLLNIPLEEIVREGPFLQTKTARHEGCQIDYMIQTRFNTLYVCEIKFLKITISKKIIKEMEEKKERLKVPKNFSIRPILIHVNGVEDEIVEEGFFDKIIDFASLLKQPIV